MADITLDFRSTLPTALRKLAIFLPRTPQGVLKTVAFSLTYAAALSAGFHSSADDLITSPLFASTGVALGFSLLYGYRFVPSVVLGALFAATLLNVPLSFALSMALSAAIAGTIGAHLLHRYADFDESLERLIDVIGLCVVGVLATALAAALHSAHMVVVGQTAATDFISFWNTWWLSDLVGLFIITPFLITWLAPRRVLSPPVEAALLGAAFLGVSALAFWEPIPQITHLPLYYLTVAPLYWAAVRFGLRASTFGILITACSASAATLAGLGPFAATFATGNALPLQFGIVCFSIGGLLLTAIARERERALFSLRIHVDRLEHALDRIRDNDRAKSDFLAMLAHELRNPLAPLVSTLDFLHLSSESDAETARAVSVMAKQVRTMRRLLDDVFDITLATRRQIALEREVTDLRTVLAQAAETVEEHVRARRHTLTLALGDVPIPVSADLVRIEQVLVNILRNAVKYTDPGGHIHAECALDGETAVVRVHDNGSGIAPHLRDAIFEPFRRGVDNTPETSGLGIGLSLTKMLVELHGGTITAESPGIGRGSTFTIRLPRATAEIPVTPLAAPTPRHIPPQRILIVDDNAAAAAGLERLLTHRGHEVRTVHDGREAIAAAAATTPDVVLLDIGLPGMDGYEVARALRRVAHASLILIAITGYGQKDDADVALFDVWLTKPVGIAELDEVLSDHIRTTSSEHSLQT